MGRETNEDGRRGCHWPPSCDFLSHALAIPWSSSDKPCFGKKFPRGKGYFVAGNAQQSLEIKPLSAAPTVTPKPNISPLSPFLTTAPSINAPHAPLSGAAIREVAWADMDRPDAIIAWDALASWASESNPFFESWYLLPSLRALDPHGTVKLLRFEIDGDLAGLIPIRAERKYYRWPIPQMGNWIHPNCFLGAPLVARGLEREFWKCLLNWADKNAGLSLFLHLSHMPLDGVLHGALVRTLTEQSRNAALVHSEERAILRSNQTAEAYFETAMSGKKRKELRRQFTRLSELGAVTINRASDTTNIAEWAEEFLALEAAGWKGSAGSALASHPETAAMFRQSMAGAAGKSRLERLDLRLDGQPIAMLASFLTPPTAFSYKTAFDEAYARFSPGVLLQRENLNILGNPNITECDSCAAADHPMIDHIWRERRSVGRMSIAIGGAARRLLFTQLATAELGRDLNGGLS
ncbi:MAG: hypothetical protein RLY97_192 [Pseudomonadota bacterium]